MSLVTTKMVQGGKLDLSKAAGDAGLTEVTVAIGWDENKALAGDQFDADVTLVLTKDDETTEAGNVVFFNQKTSADGSTIHNGDNLTGAGDGDDETIDVNLGLVNPALTKGIIYVSIYDAIARNQNFGMLNNAFVRILNKTTGEELAKFDLEFDADTATSFRFGTLINRKGSWYFSAEKIAVAGGINEVVAAHVK